MTTEEKFEAESAEAAAACADNCGDPEAHEGAVPLQYTIHAEDGYDPEADCPHGDHDLKECPQIALDISDSEARVEGAPVDVNELRVTRAWIRARRALQLAVRAGAPLPSVRMFPDGSAEFIFPGRLAVQLKGNAQDLTACIGHNRLSIASVVAEDADAVSIAVPGDVLGRERD